MVFGKRKVCTVDELNDLSTRVMEITDAIRKLSESDQVSLAEGREALRKLKLELETALGELKKCAASLEDTEEAKKRLLGNYVI